MGTTRDRMTLLRKRDQAMSLFSFKRDKRVGMLISEIPKGGTVTTAGGHTGRVTGKRTDIAIQIELLDGKHIGEFDWISKLAHVALIKEKQK